MPTCMREMLTLSWPSKVPKAPITPGRSSWRVINKVFEHGFHFVVVDADETEVLSVTDQRSRDRG